MTSTESDSLVDYARDGAIVTLTLNRPEKLNAFNDELVGALSEALHRFDAGPTPPVSYGPGRRIGAFGGELAGQPGHDAAQHRGGRTHWMVGAQTHFTEPLVRWAPRPLLRWMMVRLTT